MELTLDVSEISVSSSSWMIGRDSSGGFINVDSRLEEGGSTGAATCSTCTH